MESHVAATGFAAFVVVAALVRVADYAKPLSADPGQFLYVGETVANGGMPYADAANNKGPLTALLFAAIDPLVGTSPTAVRLTVVPFAALAALALAGYVAHHAGRAAGALAGLLCAALSGLGTFEGAEVKTEQFGVAPMFGALWLATRGGLAATAGAGALVGCAVLINPAFALAVPVVAAELALGARRGRRFRELALAAAGSVVPIAAVTVWLLVGGALDDALAQIADQVDEAGFGIDDRTAVAAPAFLSIERLRGNLPAAELWVLAFVACAVAARETRLRRASIVMAVALVAVLLRVKVVRYEFAYHYYLAVPAMCGAIALGIAALWRSRPLDRLALAALVLAFPLWGLVVHPQRALLRMDSAERLPGAARAEPVADFVARCTTREERILVAGGRAEVYWRAERRAPTRFFDVHGLTGDDDWRERARDLARDPPAAVAIVAPDRLEDDAGLTRLVRERDYELAYDRAGSRVWLRPGTPAARCGPIA
jgi:hypothetical protein